MIVSIQGLVDFIKSQPADRLTTSALWDPCVVADYVRETRAVFIPRSSVSKQLDPYVEYMKLDAEFGKIVDILSQPAIPDTYGELPTFLTMEFPKTALLLQTRAVAQG